MALRGLRAATGLTVRDLADRTGYSVGAISEATSGGRLPSLELTTAFVQCCGADSGEWEQRWRLAAARLKARGSTGVAAGSGFSAGADSLNSNAPEPSPLSDGARPGLSPDPQVFQPPVPAGVRVSTPSGTVVGIAVGRSLVFGRSEDADLAITAGADLPDRAGLISVMDGGVWIANISPTHALYIETESGGNRILLPPMADNDEPPGGWLMRAGTALVGSQAMVDDGLPLVVTVTGTGHDRGISEKTAEQLVVVSIVDDHPDLCYGVLARLPQANSSFAAGVMAATVAGVLGAGRRRGPPVGCGTARSDP